MCDICFAPVARYAGSRQMRWSAVDWCPGRPECAEDLATLTGEWVQLRPVQLKTLTRPLIVLGGSLQAADPDGKQRMAAMARQTATGIYAAVTMSEPDADLTRVSEEASWVTI
jgi:hypothetical protein